MLKEQEKGSPLVRKGLWLPQGEWQAKQATFSQDCFRFDNSWVNPYTYAFVGRL